MPETDGSASADQIRAAEKRKAAADVADAAKESWREQEQADDTEPDQRSAPPKGRRKSGPKSTG